VHTHEHDEAGRTVRTVVTREPEWDEESYGLVAALADLEASTCDGCGMPLDECMSADADRLNRAGTHYYEADAAPTRCHACSARERAVDAYAKQPNAQVTQALRWSVRRVDRDTST
jgi:ferredoxin